MTMTNHTSNELIERIITLIINMHTRAEAYAEENAYDFDEDEDVHVDEFDIGVSEGIQNGVAWTLLELRRLQEQLESMKSKV